MKTKILKGLVLFTLATGLFSSHSRAQTYTIVQRFLDGPVADQQEGYTFLTRLVLSGGTLFGTGDITGTNRNGTVFAFNTDGSGLATLHNFSSSIPILGSAVNTNSDGQGPIGDLVSSGNMLYGTTVIAGPAGAGTVYAVNTNGTGFTTVHGFGYANGGGGEGDYPSVGGSNPQAGLVLSGNRLYGTTAYGGTFGYGTVFAVNTDGSGFATLHNFSASSDGANPQADLVLSGGTLYGTAYYGGTNGAGTVFAVNTDGTGFVAVHTFAVENFYIGGDYTNSDGSNPQGGLALSGNTLYGTTYVGGTNGNGTVFAVNTDGTGFGVLYNFSPDHLSSGTTHTNSDGADPEAGLVLSGNVLYGTTYTGGTNGGGTLFAVGTNGTGFTLVHTFSPPNSYYDEEEDEDFYTNSAGSNPQAGLLLAGNTLYGTTYHGSTNGGTAFSLTLSPAPELLNLQVSGGNAVLTWDNPAFLLEAAPAVTGPWSTISGAVSPYSAAITNTMQFFQLVNPGGD